MARHDSIVALRRKDELQFGKCRLSLGEAEAEAKSSVYCTLWPTTGSCCGVEMAWLSFAEFSAVSVKIE
jgi:hypothetical protein